MMKQTTYLSALLLVLFSVPSVFGADPLYIAAKRLHIGNGTSIENGAVIVIDGLITYAGPSAGAITPNGARVIEIESGSITPGLVEANGRVESSDMITAPRRRAEDVVRDLFGDRLFQQENSIERRIANGTIGPEELDKILHGGKKDETGPLPLDPADDQQGCCALCSGMFPKRESELSGGLASGVNLNIAVTEQSAEIVPHTAVVDTMDLLSPDFQRLAREGVTTVYCSPDSSAVIGPRGTILRTSGPAENRVVLSTAAVKATIGSDPTFVGTFNRTPSRWAGVSKQTRRPTTRMGVTWVFRKAFHDSLLRKGGRPASGGADTPTVEASATLIEVLDRKVPLRIQARTLQDIETAFRLTAEFGLAFVLEEATEAYKCLDLLKATGVPIVFGPIYDTAERSPRLMSGDSRNSKLNTMTQLRRAGIETALSAQELREEDGLARQAMYAIRYGLTLEEALSAVTSIPAKILGIDNQVGTLEVGKRADIVVWNGEPFAATSMPVVVVAGGEVAVDRRAVK